MKTYCHAPWVPEGLEPLWDLAYNLWWTTDPEARRLMSSLNPGLFRHLDGNPVMALRLMTKSELKTRANDEDFCHQIHELRDRMVAELSDGDSVHVSSGPGEAELTLPRRPVAAYFSAEFGLHECLPIYSGGLGVLAGDHMRSSSDLSVPLVGVGLLYRYGYFRQRFSLDDWQAEHYVPHGCHNMPLKLIETNDGVPLIIEIKLPGRTLRAQAWICQVGRNGLLLLDSYIRDNHPEDREVTARLYDSDREIRLKQEILLGIGGTRLLEALGVEPQRFHMNEGHSAFLALERAATIIAEENLSFEEARMRTRESNVFTTHTPVPAGHEVFDRTLMESHFLPRLDRLRITPEQFFRLGRQEGAPDEGRFEMTSLAIRFSARINGVSKLHGEVARAQHVGHWAGSAVGDVPIGHITNGVHLPFWVGPDMHDIFCDAVGHDWRERCTDEDAWSGILNAADGDVWRARCAQRSRMIDFVQVRAQNQLITQNVDRDTIIRKITGLDPNALTLGFARRFATYKRAMLLFRNRERISQLLRDPDRPVQIIMSGKAHPADGMGKDLMREVIRLSRSEDFFGRLIVLEDYDINVARHLVQGVDVWVNTPRPPQEASGTSGMKACANGALTLSADDGWWAEAKTPIIGWTFGDTDSTLEEDAADDRDGLAIIQALEQEIVPEFYDRDENGHPARWLARVKESIRTICPRFNTSRMVAEYVRRYYLD